jgi:hypothetical protein
VNRNVIATANPWERQAHADAAALAQAIGAHLLPRSRAWHEIWIDSEQFSGGEEEDEPIYGRTYMPRKFKIAIAVPPHNDVDVFAHDLGLIAIEQAGRIVGYNVVVGGGMGMTHGEPDTFPRTGDVIGFCTPGQAVDLAEKVVTVQRDFGDRSDRKHARLKYTVERLGLPAFVEELQRRLGYALAPPRAFAFAGNGDETEIVGEDIDIVRRRDRDGNLELSRQIGLAIDRLHDLGLAAGDPGAIEPNLAIRAGARRQVIGQRTGQFQRGGMRARLIGIDVARDIAVDVTAGRDGIEQSAVDRAERGFQIRFDDTMKLHGLPCRQPDGAVGISPRNLIQRKPLRRLQHAAGNAHPQHKSEGLLQFLAAALGAQVAVVLQIHAVEFDELLIVFDNCAGDLVPQTFGQSAA